MKMLIPALVLVTSSIVAGQRGSFAGLGPIGFPDTPNRTTTTPDPLGNRFGEGSSEILPIEANGDRDLIDRLSKLPIDKQPFWFINWQSYDKHRKDPQTYPQRPNSFLDPIPLNANSGQVNNGFSTPTPGFIGTEPTVILNSFGEGTPERLPIEANGDRDLIDRLSKLPIDKQPFWFINWQAYDKHRKDPQTHPQRPNSFVDPIPLNTNSGQVNNGFSTPTPGFIGTEPTVIFNRFGTTNAPSQPSNKISPSGNINNNAFPFSNIFYPNSNVYPNVNGNSNSNVYPSGNSNPTSNIYNNYNPNPYVYPTGNPISNVYPTGNPISNVYPTGNPISNVYPTGNPISNVYPTGNSNSNVYPTGNSNSNVYPTGNSNSNVYPIGNPTGKPNSNVYQTSNLNSHSNSGAVTKHGTSFQTTQQYHWDSFFMSSHVRTDTHPQRSGHELF